VFSFYKKTSAQAGGGGHYLQKIAFFPHERGGHLSLMSFSQRFHVGRVLVTHLLKLLLVPATTRV
jgi:hypothetical protein